MHLERSLVDVLQLHTDLMVAGSKIELGEESGTVSSSRSSSTTGWGKRP
jgi:hypothetical protein